MISTASLFCGAGGEMAGKELAFEELGIPVIFTENLAINHWDLAVATARFNFPCARVKQEDITKISASSLGIKHLDLLWASPSCTHFSNARGGVPCSDQQRSHADEVIDRWLAEADVDVFLMENVAEFRTWGPLLRRSTRIGGKIHPAGRPDPRRKGVFFERFITKLVELGYQVEHRILCAADYGVPTTRRRVFLQAVRDGRPITWPEPTHAQPKRCHTGNLPAWRTAAQDVIDWSERGTSIFGRKKPLSKNSLRRIKYGLKKHGLRPYLQYLTHTKTNMSSIGSPLPTVTAKDHNWLLEPYLTEYHNGPFGDTRVRGLNEPIPTLDTSNRFFLAQPYLIEYYGTGTAASVGSPLHTVTAKPRHAIIQIALRRAQEGTLPIVRTEADIDALDLTTPFLIEVHGKKFLVDILYRLLRPRELARAMGFPDWFQWRRVDGKPLTIEAQVKMIGNACPVGVVKAIIKAVVLARPERYGLAV